MASNILSKPNAVTQEYQLPESVRRQIIQESSKRPAAQISLLHFGRWQQQRQRFIAMHGNDGIDS